MTSSSQAALDCGWAMSTLSQWRAEVAAFAANIESELDQLARQPASVQTVAVNVPPTPVAPTTLSEPAQPIVAAQREVPIPPAQANDEQDRFSALKQRLSRQLSGQPGTGEDAQ